MIFKAFMWFSAGSALYDAGVSISNFQQIGDMQISHTVYALMACGLFVQWARKP